MKKPASADIWTLSGDVPDDLVSEIWIAARKTARRARLAVPKDPVQESFLWDTVVDLAEPWLQRRGEKARLARLLGVSRQAIHQHFVARTTRPDAERTLQTLVWLADKRAAGRSGT